MRCCSLLRRLLNKTSLGRTVTRGMDLLKADRDWPAHDLPGHYSSPAPSLREIEADRDRIFAVPREGLPGIDLNESVQQSLLGSFAAYYGELPFPEESTVPWRYCYHNTWFRKFDAIILYCMLRHFRPSRVVEIGSGYSSAVILDTCDGYLGGKVHCTFVDPNPRRLTRLLRPEDRVRCAVIPQRVQQIDLSVFRELAAGDLLFVDSSHVSKVGSDVNWLVFEVLPRLASGVLVHFHDVFYPFDYPIEWFRRGFGWNEAYLLRAFLQFNKRFEIIFFSSFMEKIHPHILKTNMPACLESSGQSLWLRACG
jgi:Methyltransferase domain